MRPKASEKTKNFHKKSYKKIKINFNALSKIKTHEKITNLKV